MLHVLNYTLSHISDWEESKDDLRQEGGEKIYGAGNCGRLWASVVPCGIMVPGDGIELIRTGLNE